MHLQLSQGVLHGTSFDAQEPCGRRCVRSKSDRISTTDRLCCADVAHLIRFHCNSVVATARPGGRSSRSQAAGPTLAWLWFPAWLSSAAKRNDPGLWLAEVAQPRAGFHA